jgi:hypothetical protein
VLGQRLHLLPCARVETYLEAVRSSSTHEFAKSHTWM